jgi:ABC-type dipeptide/oligopeptide/nickel transport system ATPase component
MDSALLSMRLSARYGGREVLHDVVLDIAPGEVVGLVGQSGSGKSTLALSVLGLQRRDCRLSGEIRFRGSSLLGMKETELRRLRGKDIALVLQNPVSSLNPVLRIETQLKEAWTAHSGVPWTNQVDTALRLLASLDLPASDSFLRRFPSQISVGQAQRVLIAMAILHKPALLIADEPTSALDVVTQMEVLQIFARLNRELRMSVLYISHDLFSIASFCHRLAILHEGSIVECNTTAGIFAEPRHPFTRRLIEAMPKAPDFSVQRNSGW